MQAHKENEVNADIVTYQKILEFDPLVNLYRHLYL